MKMSEVPRREATVMWALGQIRRSACSAGKLMTASPTQVGEWTTIRLIRSDSISSKVISEAPLGAKYLQFRRSLLIGSALKVTEPRAVASGIKARRYERLIVLREHFAQVNHYPARYRSRFCTGNLSVVSMTF